jgi:hypothetical protein
MLKITDYERIATVTPTQLGQIECPKCKGVCNERGPEKRSSPAKRREWDCNRCGRGWVQVPEWVMTLHDAYQNNEMEEIIERLHKCAIQERLEEKIKKENEEAAIGELQSANLLDEGFGKMTRKQWIEAVENILKKHNIVF